MWQERGTRSENFWSQNKSKQKLGRELLKRKKKQCKSIKVETESSAGKHTERTERAQLPLITPPTASEKKCDFFFILSFLEKNCFKRCDIKIYSKIFEEVARFSRWGTLPHVIAMQCDLRSVNNGNELMWEGLQSVSMLWMTF